MVLASCRRPERHAKRGSTQSKTGEDSQRPLFLPLVESVSGGKFVPRSKGYRDWHKHYSAEKLSGVQPPELPWKHVRAYATLLSTDSSGNFILFSQLAKLHQRLEVRTKATGPVSATCLPSKGLEPCSCECRLQG